MKTDRGDFSKHPRLHIISGLALVIGAIGALVAKLLLMMIALFTQVFFFANFSFEPAKPSMAFWGPFFILVPVVGGLIIGLMARFGSEKIRGHGIPEALEAILFGKSIMQPKVAILKPISSAVSIGSGGPFGAEGPIIMTGGAVGSLIAQCFHLTASERKTLLVAGAAAGMSAIFATPIAAVLLAVELLLFEWKPRSLVPVALASSVAAVLRIHLFGSGPLFPVAAHPALADIAVLEAVFVGLAAGAFSALLSKTLYLLEDVFHKLPIHWMWWPALGGLAVGVGGYLEPRALGVGYDVIGDFLSGTISHREITSIFLVKATIWLFALASGTSGGVLAPLLIFGCSLGALEAPFLASGSPAIWSLISMGAILAGMMRSPLTAIFFAFELTGDGGSLLPLLVASITAYAFTVLFMKRSILTEKVARRGYDIFREYGVDPLQRVTVGEVMNGKSKAGAEGLSEEDLIQREPIVITADQNCTVAAEIMAEHDLERLIVVSAGDSREIAGILTHKNLLRAWQNHLHEERKLERRI